ncbi:collagen alpha-1(I) chain-like [Rhinolophus ferrumequinum]|uniref:collagen alpha-1(I) chain-like n=1 Tax=Rhinolophus ferrumequinum TaxID=59479 RepID=UPI00140FE370|nr:collagen alpha-1(I) chain-like [Rhinolophus ferrumequinum]
MRGGPPDPPGGAARAAGEGAVTQPPSARLPGTLQQLEPPLLQERKAFVPQCQGCQGKREAGRLPLPGGTQDTTLPRGLPAQNGLMVPSPLSPFTKPGLPSASPAATAAAPAAETWGCPRKGKGRRVQGGGQGAPEDAQGPGRQLGRRAGGQYLTPGSPSPRQYQTLRLLCTRRGAEDFPRTKPTAGVAANFTAYNPLPCPSCQPPGLRESAFGAWLYVLGQQERGPALAEATTGRKFAIPRRGPGRARGSSRQPRGGPRLPLRRAVGAEKASRSSTGRAGGRAPGRARAPAAASSPRRPPTPTPRSRLPRLDHHPRRAPPPIRGRRPQPQALKPGAASSWVSESRRRRQTGFLRPLRPLPAARTGPSDGRGGTRRLRGPGPGGGARRAGREEPREKGRRAGATRAASC